MSISTAAICFIACHGGSADHFAVYAEKMIKDGFNIKICSVESQSKKFQDRALEIQTLFSLDKLSQEEEEKLAEQIVKTCSVASVVITDVGSSFDIKIQKAFDKYAPKIIRLAYYDNPEPYVPGGYSLVAAEVMLTANGVLFANANLVKTTLFQEPNKEVALSVNKRFGIGYYPLNQAEKILKRREAEHVGMRSKVLTKFHLEEQGQKIFVYFGGNNDEYFKKAFPAYLNFLAEAIKLKDLSNMIIVLQQHPAAKAKNLDGIQVSEWIKEYSKVKNSPKLIISDFSSDDAQVLADTAMYYQTSMGPQFVLAGIPTFQVGHETYEDILVRNGLCPSATNVDQFVSVLEEINHRVKQERQDKLIYKGLGIKEDWLNSLKGAINKAHETTTPLSGRQIQKTDTRYYLAAGSIILIGYLGIRYFNQSV